jgi:hypothetical protein
MNMIILKTKDLLEGDVISGKGGGEIEKKL